jgi:hypothetical protein
MIHAALLLLMLEAVAHGPRFTISPKRSTQNLQLSTSWPADYPIYRSNSGHAADIEPTLMTHLGSGGCIAAVETINSDFCSRGREITGHAADHTKGVRFARLVQ